MAVLRPVSKGNGSGPVSDDPTGPGPFRLSAILCTLLITSAISRPTVGFKVGEVSGIRLPHPFLSGPSRVPIHRRWVLWMACGVANA